MPRRSMRKGRWDLGERVRTHGFTVYLAKPGLSVEQCVVEDHGLEPVEAAASAPAGMQILVQRGAPHEPWWKQYFAIDFEVPQQSNGAIVSLPVDNRLFLLTFGFAAYQLRDESYDHYFGMRVVLNSVDPVKLKNTD